MIPYIGDISKEDAEVLACLASDRKNILEFGCGASTQVIAAHTKGRFTSIDTEEAWIEKTKSNLSLLKIDKEVEFHDYYAYMEDRFNPDRVDFMNPGIYDFIFVDGADGLRRQFAIDIWELLEVGGAMVFHDTRRAHDFRNMLEVMAKFHNEIAIAEINMSVRDMVEGTPKDAVEGSNISMLIKKHPKPYENWQITEKREPWQLGYGDPPQEFIDSIKTESI